MEIFLIAAVVGVESLGWSTSGLCFAQIGLGSLSGVIGGFALTGLLAASACSRDSICCCCCTATRPGPQGAVISRCPCAASW